MPFQEKTASLKGKLSKTYNSKSGKVGLLGGFLATAAVGATVAGAAPITIPASAIFLAAMVLSKAPPLVSIKKKKSSDKADLNNYSLRPAKLSFKSNELIVGTTLNKAGQKIFKTISMCGPSKPKQALQKLKKLIPGL